MTRARAPALAVLVWAIAVAVLGSAPAGCASSPPRFSEELRARTFDRYWGELEENYPFFEGAGPDRRGVDWARVRERYRPRALAAEHPDDFYHVLVGMLSELDDPHVSLRPPPERPNEPMWTSPGLPSRAMVDREWYILGWGDNPPAAPPPTVAGREFVYPRLVRVDGQRASLMLVDDLLLGRPGTSVGIELEWPDGSTTRHVMQRPIPEPPPAIIDGKDNALLRDPALLRQIARLLAGNPVEVRRVEDVAYLRVDSFDSEDALVNQAEYIKMLDTAIDSVVDCRGVIIDLRNNPGGEARIMSDFVGRFTDRTMPMGTIRLPLLWVFPVTVEWEIRPRPPHCPARLAVLTSPLTGSSAEHAAKLLRERGDCVIIGGRTAGAEAAVETVRGPDGSVMNYGRRRITDGNGQGLQFVGVEPDVRIEMTRELLESVGAEAAQRELRNRRFYAALEALDAVQLWPRFVAKDERRDGPEATEPTVSSMPPVLPEAPPPAPVR